MGCGWVISGLWVESCDGLVVMCLERSGRGGRGRKSVLMMVVCVC